MKGSPIYEMRLKVETRERWAKAAKDRGVSLPELIRAAVEKELAGHGLPPLVSPDELNDDQVKAMARYAQQAESIAKAFRPDWKGGKPPEGKK